MSESRSIAELNKKALMGALTVMKAFCDQINLHQATMLKEEVTNSKNIPLNSERDCRNLQCTC
jgi:hypothetical protein